MPCRGLINSNRPRIIIIVDRASLRLPQLTNSPRVSQIISEHYGSQATTTWDATQTRHCAHTACSGRRRQPIDNALAPPHRSMCSRSAALSPPPTAATDKAHSLLQARKRTLWQQDPIRTRTQSAPCSPRTQARTSTTYFSSESTRHAVHRGWYTMKANSRLGW